MEERYTGLESLPVEVCETAIWIVGTDSRSSSGKYISYLYHQPFPSSARHYCMLFPSQVPLSQLDTYWSCTRLLERQSKTRYAVRCDTGCAA